MPECDTCSPTLPPHQLHECEATEQGTWDRLDCASARLAEAQQTGIEDSWWEDNEDLVERPFPADLLSREDNA